MNQLDEIACSALSNDHVADMKMIERLVNGLEAKIYADRSYVNQDLKIRLNEKSVDLITYHLKNIQIFQLTASDEYHLRQRNKIISTCASKEANNSHYRIIGLSRIWVN